MKQIQTNNLIAQFIGGYRDERDITTWNFTNVDGFVVTESPDNFLEFDKNWEWLMFVVEKIETIQLPRPSMVTVRVSIKGEICRIFKGEWNENKEGFISSYTHVTGTKLEATYYSVVEFIKWYNKNILKK